MPYIKSANYLSAAHNPKDPGELNFAFTALIQIYLRSRLVVNYQALNDVVGALESCKAEFQRRIVARYEDTKIEANGDVY